MRVAWTAILLAVAVCARADDVVLLRARHGAHAHRDAVRCAGATDAALRIEDVIEQLMLPTALWCDTDDNGSGALCHDRTGHRALRAVALHCDTGEAVRCVAEFECAPLVAELCGGAATTLAACALLLAAHARCRHARGSSRRRKKLA